MTYCLKKFIQDVLYNAINLSADSTRGCCQDFRFPRPKSVIIPLETTSIPRTREGKQHRTSQASPPNLGCKEPALASAAPLINADLCGHTKVFPSGLCSCWLDWISSDTCWCCKNVVFPVEVEFPCGLWDIPGLRCSLQSNQVFSESGSRAVYKNKQGDPLVWLSIIWGFWVIPRTENQK